MEYNFCARWNETKSYNQTLLSHIRQKTTRMTKKFAHVKVGFHRPNLGWYRFIALPNSKPHIHSSISLFLSLTWSYSLDNAKENLDEEFAYRLRSKYLEVGVVGLKEFLHHPKKAFHKQIQVLRVASLEKRVDSLHCHVDEAEKAHVFRKRTF